MKKISFDQSAGIITVAGMDFGKKTEFNDFKKIFFEKTRLMYGRDGTGQYALKDLVKFLGNDFRVYFRFSNDHLQSLNMKLVSGVAKERQEEYPEYDELQREVEYLYGLYKDIFNGELKSEYEWKKIWFYEWGRIILSQEAHSSQVVTDFSWGA